MQRTSFRESAHRRLRIYPSAEADEVKSALLAAAHPPGERRRLLYRIGQLLLEEIKKSGGWETATYPPVVVLRGGLLMCRPIERVLGHTPTGLIAPLRNSPMSDPTVRYASIPPLTNCQFALVDMLMASGRTMVACAEAIRRQLGTDTPGARFVAPFVASDAWRLLLSRFPKATIDCLWHRESVGSDGRMVGPGFDLGDLAIGCGQSCTSWGGH